MASAAQWVYQFLLSSRAADLATVAQSQILGYPAGFDGLSGEWPCGSMVDWRERRLNHKFWAQLALLQAVARPFSFCETNVTAAAGRGGLVGVDPSTSPVYAQGLTSAKGRVMVLINTKAVPQAVDVPGAAGKFASTIDDAVGNEAARISTLETDIVQLGPFATMFVSW